MRFDSNQAWKEATAAVTANRELLLALAGVFFLLPSFAASVLVPQPQPQPGATPGEIYAQIAGIYAQIWPYVLVAGLLQIVGVLAILTLVTDRSRPTVGEALVRGITGTPSFLAVQFMMFVVAVVVMGLGSALAAVSGSGGVVAVVVIAGIAFFVWLWLRLSLIGPAIAVERIYNPLQVFARSWRLTRGNTARLLLFFFLLAIAFIVIVAIAMGVTGVILALLLPAEPAKIVAGLISATLTSVFMLYFIAALAAAHRQLAGPSGEAAARTFE